MEIKRFIIVIKGMDPRMAIGESPYVQFVVNWETIC
jgi:hypothetical protein